MTYPNAIDRITVEQAVRLYEFGVCVIIDEGGQRVMEAWVEGAEKGIKDGVPALTSGLEKVKNLFGTIWGKVPEEIRGPIEQAMTWMTDLIGQAEEALFKLDDFQNELNALMGGDGSPEDETQGFMARLTKSLDEKLKAINSPIDRFASALVDSAGELGSVAASFKTIIESNRAMAEASEEGAKDLKNAIQGSWIDIILSLIMETESFAKAMELLGKVMKPIVALFDIILRPIIEGLLKLWNGIIDALASISIFGWKPFKGLTQHKVSWDDDAGGGSGGRDGGTGGRQISEITGPTRDLLVDLLSPLANFGAIVAPIQDIRNILYERMPNFNALSLDFAGVGAGAIGPGVVIENITVHSSAKDGRQLARDMMDEIERDGTPNQLWHQREGWQVIKLTNALGAEKILPLTMSFRRVPLEIDVPSQPLLGLDGDVVTGKSTLRPRQFTLEGGIYHWDKGRIERELDALLSFLMRSPVEVYRQHYHNRFLRAHPLGAPQDWLDGGAELALRIPMVAHDPYWYGPEVEVTVSGTQTITVEGTAPTYPLITTAGSVSSLVVSNALTGKEFVVAGATGVIEVDCDKRNMSVTVGGVNRIDLIDDNWVLHSWALLPGENQITTNTPITLAYRSRWY